MEVQKHKKMSFKLFIAGEPEGTNSPTSRLFVANTDKGPREKIRRPAAPIKIRLEKIIV